MESKKHIVAITAVIKYNDKFLIVKRHSKEKEEIKKAFPDNF